MKICICTTPIRPYPTDFPPFGSMAIIQSLRKIGEDAIFFNIDYFRYEHEEIESYFKAHQFDVVGISAVVSTAYVYTKYLAGLIRKASPSTTIIVGGNLAASAEILLRKTEVDLCVVGDGELIIRDLIQVLYEKPVNYDRLRATKGICFLDEHDAFQFTGFGKKLEAEEIEFQDYGILESDGSLDYFINDKVTERFYAYEGIVEQDKKVATVVMAKGCVARCTFCHRWERGFRVLPADKLLENIRFLISRYKVGFIQVADENFGADREVAWAIASGLGALGLKWQAAGVRTSTVSKESLQHWKDNGCVSVFYGIETGSRKMLAIMEKNTTLEKNISALKWAGEAGLNTIIQLVIGMPGEDDGTIYETIEFLNEVSPSIRQWKGKVASDSISINYAQALPGTPLYEYGREHGLIGKSIDEEEKYLIKISDTDAYKEDQFVNMTGLPLLKVLMWRSIILAHLDAHRYGEWSGGDAKLSLSKIIGYYVNVVGHRIYRRVTKSRKKGEAKFTADLQQADYVSDSGYFNIHSGLKFAPLLLNPITRFMFYPLLAIATVLRTASSPLQGMRMLLEHVRWKLEGGMPAQVVPERSLRKIIKITPSTSDQSGIDLMLPLRKGR
jgi:anaerobic magnesium-protoporphyrin IX monomethyl ester cyclase